MKNKFYIVLATLLFLIITAIIHSFRANTECRIRNSESGDDGRIMDLREELQNENASFRRQADVPGQSEWRGGVPPNELVSLPWTREKAFLAQREFWWGKPFDSDSFWQDRPIWLDEETATLAIRRGRCYPPVPPQFAKGVPQKQLVSDASSIEYRMPRMYYTEEEELFWGDFTTHSPQPPESIDRWLQRASCRRMTCTSRINVRLPNGSLIKRSSIPLEKEPQFTVSVLRRESERLSMPVEAATENALYWEYVRGMRLEYEHLVQRSRETGNNRSLQFFLRRLECPAALVENPPSEEEVRVTTGWRIEYLRRLRREGTDESYIEAYKKAWGITEEQLREKEP